MFKESIHLDLMMMLRARDLAHSGFLMGWDAALTFLEESSFTWSSQDDGCDFFRGLGGCFEDAGKERFRPVVRGWRF